MRALGLHSDVIVLVSRVWQTTCSLVRSGAEAFAVDSPLYPDELDSLGALVAQTGFAVCGLLATHADFDHLLGPLAFPDAALGVCETSAARLRAEPGAAQRELRRFDELHYVARDRPLALGAVQALPVPGRCELGGSELELLPADGHTQDGMAIWVPWARVLICGDYVSPVEIPVLGEGASLGGYRATLARLRGYVERAEHVVPGHGEPLRRDVALKLLGEDDAYLQALGAEHRRAALPSGRADARQREIHATNVRRLAGDPA